MAKAEPLKSTAADMAATEPAVPTKLFNGTLYDAVSSTPQLSSFMAALNETGLAATLRTKGPFTVFAPDNEAFARLPEGLFDKLMATPDHMPLKALLSRYIVSAKVPSADPGKKGTSLTALSGEATMLKRTPEGILYNGSLLTDMDIQTKNGMLNIVSSINPPPPAPKTTPQPEKAAPAAAPAPAAPPSPSHH